MSIRPSFLRSAALFLFAEHEAPADGAQADAEMEGAGNDENEVRSADPAHVAAELSDTFARTYSPHQRIRDVFVNRRAEQPGLVCASLEGSFLSFAGPDAARVATAMKCVDRLVTNCGVARFCIVLQSRAGIRDLASIGVFPVLVGTTQDLLAVVRIMAVQE